MATSTNGSDSGLDWCGDCLSEHLFTSSGANIDFHKLDVANEQLHYIKYKMCDRTAALTGFTRAFWLGLMPVGTDSTHYHFIFNRLVRDH